MPKKEDKKLGVTLQKHGAEFRVWAPFAESVALIGTFSNWEEIAMVSSDEGVWSVTVDDVKVGQSYRYRLRNGGNTFERNDPRARQLTSSNTEAQETASVIIDDDNFAWGAEDFTLPPKNEQIIYEMHIGTFNRADAATGGTFSDAIEKLDYLKELGINMIELLPVTSMDKTHNWGWGYLPNHLFSVDVTYGGRRGLLEFVDACHKRGIGVILDVVYNHLSAHTELWRYDGWSENGGGGIYFYNDERGNTPWGSRPDYGRSEVRQFILDNVLMWLTEYRIDGLRLDSTIFMRNIQGNNNDPAHDIGDAWTLLGDITALAHKVRPDSNIIAEDVGGNEYLTKNRADGGCGFDAQWEVGFPHSVRSSIGLMGDLGALSSRLGHMYNGNPFERVVFSDSHDSAANGGARLSETITPENPDSVFARAETVLANALTLTAPGIPMLLQGAEFMQSGSFNDWGVLEWAKAEQFAGIMLAHRHLIDLRLNRHGNTGGLVGGSISIFHFDPSNRTIGYHRWANGGAGDDVFIIANCGNNVLKDYNITLPLPGVWRSRFNSSWKGYSPEFAESIIETLTTNDEGVISLSLRPYQVLILSQDTAG